MSGKKHKKTGGSRDGPHLAECKALLHALEAHLDENLAVESSAVLDAAVDAAADSRGLNAAFSAVLKTGALSLDGALRLALFLHGADAPSADGGDPPLGPFSADEAFAEIAQVYDRGVAAMYEDAFEDGSDTESDGSADEAK